MIPCVGFVQHSLAFIIQLFGCMMHHDYDEMYPAWVAQKTVNSNSRCNFHLFNQSHFVVYIRTCRMSICLSFFPFLWKCMEKLMFQ